MNPHQLRRYLPQASASTIAANAKDYGTGQPNAAKTAAMPDMSAVPNPECGCRACNPAAWWLIACGQCGNKRCPHATDHRNACTRSNEPGQAGSEWENVPKAAAPSPIPAPQRLASVPLSTKTPNLPQTAHDDQIDHSRQNPKLERDSGDEPLGASQVQEADSIRVRVRVVSIRKRLCDEDNLCEKFHVDCLRYLGAIPDDSPEKVSIETTQRQAAKGEDERTEITIVFP